MRDSFIFYKSWADILANVPDDTRLAIYDAVVAYATADVLPQTLDGVGMMAFNFIQNAIDRDMKKYKSICDKRREAGRKGGLAKREEQSSEANATNCKQLQASEADNDTVTENDTDTDTESIDVDKGKASRPAKKSEKENFGITMDEFRDFYNDAIKRNKSKMARCRLKIDGDRAKHITARIKEHGLDLVKECVEIATSSIFLGGDNDRHFRADIGWIMMPENFVKVMDGRYTDEQPADTPATATTPKPAPTGNHYEGEEEKTKRLLAQYEQDRKSHISYEDYKKTQLQRAQPRETA